MRNIENISVNEAVLAIICRKGSVRTHHLLYIVTAWHGQNQITFSAHQMWDDYILFSPTLSLGSPLAPAVFCSLHSANWNSHFPPFCLNFLPHQASLFHNIKRLQSVQHRETDDATTSQLSTTTQVFHKARNLIAGWNDSPPCSLVPSDQLSQVVIQKHFTLQYKNKQNWRCVSPPVATACGSKALFRHRHVCHMGIAVTIG